MFGETREGVFWKTHTQIVKLQIRNSKHYASSFFQPEQGISFRFLYHNHNRTEFIPIIVVFGQHRFEVSKRRDRKARLFLSSRKKFARIFFLYSLCLSRPSLSPILLYTISQKLALNDSMLLAHRSKPTLWSSKSFLLQF